MDAAHMVPLTTCPFAFEAKVITARLGAEGIVWQASANLDSIYPMGGVSVMVGADDLDRARELLAATTPVEVDEPHLTASHTRWTAIVVLGLLVLFVLARMLSGR